MFPNIGQMMDMIPKLEEFSKKVIGVVESIQAEQKSQRELLEAIHLQNVRLEAKLSAPLAISSDNAKDLEQVK